ncbi:MFS transporter [Chloroflexota bacterium]
MVRDSGAFCLWNYGTLQSPRYYSLVCCGIEAAGIFCVLAINGPLTLYLTMFFLGLGYGGWAVVCPVLLGDFFGSKNLGMIMGVWFTHGALVGIVGPLMGGIIFDLTQSYFLAFLIAGMSCLAGIILAALIKTPKKRMLNSKDH